ncbi:MAG: hypothetical protein ACXQS2_06305, partial [Methermicoccaceae archaeon]
MESLRHQKDAEIKALLLSKGVCRVDPKILEIAASSRISTAGPTAGIPSIFLRWGNHRVRLAVASVGEPADIDVLSSVSLFKERKGNGVDNTDV